MMIQTVIRAIKKGQISDKKLFVDTIIYTEISLRLQPTGGLPPNRIILNRISKRSQIYRIHFVLIRDFNAINI